MMDDLKWQERTTGNLSDSRDSLMFQVQAERQYVQRLKSQRQKIEALYQKYDVLLRELQSRESRLRQKQKTIVDLEGRCRQLETTQKENCQIRQLNSELRAQNASLQGIVEELQGSMSRMQTQWRGKQVKMCKRLDELQGLNEELMDKLRVLSGRYADKEEQNGRSYGQLMGKVEGLKGQARKEKQAQLQKMDEMTGSLMQREEENGLLRTQNNCLRERVAEMEARLQQTILLHQQAISTLGRQKNTQLRALRKELDAYIEATHVLERKLQKSRDEIHLKELAASEMEVSLAQVEQTGREAVNALKVQFNQQKSVLKEQLVQYESQLGRMERRIADGLRREEGLCGKVKKFQVCFEAKRNLREAERSELQKINMLLM